MLELPDEAVLDLVGRQPQFRQPADDHLEEVVAHVVARTTQEEADADETPEEHARRHHRASLAELEHHEHTAGGVLVGGPRHRKALGAPVGPVGEDEIVAASVDGVAHELAEAFWTVVVAQAGDVWYDVDLTRRDGGGIGSLREGKFTTFNTPVHEEIVKKACLGAISDLGVWATARADDRRAVIGAGELAAILFTAWPFVSVELY